MAGRAGAKRITADAITHRRVLAVALPIMASNATEPLKGAVDFFVVGQMGLAQPIAAVGAGSLIITSLFFMFGFLRMGTSGLVAQARGAGDAAETGALLMRALLIGAVGALLILVAQRAIFWGAFLALPASPEVEALTETYLEIRVWGAPAAILFYAVTGWLIAMERTFSVMLLQFWVNGTNIVLDLWFVLGLGWGVEGVALATLIAEWSGLLVGLALCGPAFAGDQWRDWARVFDQARLRRMMAVNGDIFIRSVLMVAMFVAFLFTGSAFGDAKMAANSVLVQFLQITAFALDGFAFAAEAMVGQALGAGQVAALRRASVLTSLWGLAAMVAMALGFWVFGPWLIDEITTAPDVRATARAYLPWLVAMPIIGLAAWMLDGIFIGATETRAIRRAALESFAVYLVALAVLVNLFENHGLWMALVVSYFARAATLAIRYPEIERRAMAAAV